MDQCDRRWHTNVFLQNLIISGQKRAAPNTNHRYPKQSVRELHLISWTRWNEIYFDQFIIFSFFSFTKNHLNWYPISNCVPFYLGQRQQFVTSFESIKKNTAHMIQIQKSWNHKPWQFEVEWNHKKLIIFTGNFQIRPNHRSFIGNEHTENSQLEFNHTLI